MNEYTTDHMKSRQAGTTKSGAMLCVAIACSLFCGNPAGAQDAVSDSTARDPHAVQPERPTVATHAGTVARGWIEIEEGGEWDRLADGTRSFIAPTNLKIGLASRRFRDSTGAEASDRDRGQRSRHWHHGLLTASHLESPARAGRSGFERRSNAQIRERSAGTNDSGNLDCVLRISRGRSPRMGR